MRVAIVTESHFPEVNGVAHSVARVVEHLTANGHDTLVVAPQPAGRIEPADGVVHLPSLAMPGYPTFRVGLPSRRLEAVLRSYAPDVVHLASPFALAAHGAFVADRLRLPSVAVYQTDVAAFATHYRLGVGRSAAWRWIRRVHALAGRTLAPSSAAVDDLVRHAVPRVHRWPRGVDSVRFGPCNRLRPPSTGAAIHTAACNRLHAPSTGASSTAGCNRLHAPSTGDVVVGYVGRLAAEKEIELLEPVTRLPGVQVEIVGDGPARPALERALPRARFRGQLTGQELATAYADLDVFVHTGAHETFCQTVQEAMASGVPVVAPAAGGPLDLVTPGETGLLFRPGDARQLTTAVSALVSDPATRLAFGLAGRRKVEPRTWSAVGDALLDHYDAVREPALIAQAA